MAAGSVLQILAPNLFDAFRDAVDAALHPLVWDYVFVPLLYLPGWLLLGVPGGVLVWRFQPAPDPHDAGLDSFPQASYEEIVAAAREADEEDIGIPSKYRDLDEYDPARHGATEGNDPALDPLYIEQADVVPPARHIPSGDGQGGIPGGTQGGTAAGDGDPGRGGGGLNRPF